MSADEFLHATPPEINVKIEAWNEDRKRDATRDYASIVALLNGHKDPKKFPTFDRFYPEIDPKTQKRKVSRQVSQAMKTARLLGDI